MVDYMPANTALPGNTAFCHWGLNPVAIFAILVCKNANHLKISWKFLPFTIEQASNV
jgi:hypothetical protein